MKTLAVLFLVLYPTLLYQQNKSITSFVKLDTIINLQIICDYDQLNEDDLKLQLLGDKVWIFYPNWTENDSLHYLTVDVKTKELREHNLYVPSLSFKTNSPIIKHFHVTDSGLVVLFSNNVYIYFKKIKGNYEFSFIEPLSNTMESVYCLNSKTLLFANMYNSHPKSNPDPVVFKLYDINQKKIVRSLVPKFDAIEFSHFSPSHWLSVYGNSVLISQTANYKFTVYDGALEKKEDIISKPDSSWIYADTTFIRVARNMKPRKGGKEWIGLLSPMQDSISRIEAVYFLDKKTILARKIPAYSKAKNHERLYDLWVKDAQGWQIRQSNIYDRRASPDSKIEKNNFPVMSRLGTTDMNINHFVKLQVMFHDIEFEKTYADQKKAEEKMLADSVQPKFYLYIYKNNFK